MTGVYMDVVKEQTEHRDADHHPSDQPWSATARPLREERLQSL